MTEQDWLDEFGENLKYIMDSQNITQRELADRAHLSKSTINDYIHKRKMPGVKAIINMSQALNCDIEDLMDISIGIIE